MSIEESNGLDLNGLREAGLDMLTRRMPVQKPGRSKQDYETPDELIQAVIVRFGNIWVDLAATSENAKASRFITPEQDSFSVPWAKLYRGCNMWLNPPFADIGPWAEKCTSEAQQFKDGSRIFLLTPASVGANWFEDHVYGKADVLALKPRLTFKGAKDPYPKDCMLSVFSRIPKQNARLRRFEVWDWRKWSS